MGVSALSPGCVGWRRGIGSRLLDIHAASRGLLLVSRLEGGRRVHRLEAVAFLELQ